ncbi:sulfite reductase, partial [Staphylococcus aureus]
IGLIAIIEQGELIGFNITIGGGMGMTHGNKETYPQLGRLIGFIPKDKAVDVCEKLLTIQRDYGNRENRKNARFKYTVDRLGEAWVTEELNRRLGWEIESANDYEFDHNGDRLGWIEGENNWNYTLFIQNGRVKDTEDYQLKTALREIAETHTGDFRLSPNQNLVIANISPEKKNDIQQIIDKYQLTDGTYYTGLRRNSMACV